MIKKFSKKDPYQKRESVRYKDPIPSRELILEYLEKSGKPQSKNDIERGLFIKKSTPNYKGLKITTNITTISIIVGISL